MQIAFHWTYRLNRWKIVQLSRLVTLDFSSIKIAPRSVLKAVFCLILNQFYLFKTSRQLGYFYFHQYALLNTKPRKKFNIVLRPICSKLDTKIQDLSKSNYPRPVARLLRANYRGRIIKRGLFRSHVAWQPNKSTRVEHLKITRTGTHKNNVL